MLCIVIGTANYILKARSGFAQFGVGCTAKAHMNNLDHLCRGATPQYAAYFSRFVSPEQLRDQLGHPEPESEESRTALAILTDHDQSRVDDDSLARLC
jgi:hypothetical protein